MPVLVGNNADIGDIHWDEWQIHIITGTTRQDYIVAPYTGLWEWIRVHIFHKRPRVHHIPTGIVTTQKSWTLDASVTLAKHDPLVQTAMAYLGGDQVPVTCKIDADHEYQGMMYLQEFSPQVVDDTSVHVYVKGIGVGPLAYV